MLYVYYNLFAFRTLPPDSQLVEVEKSAEDHQREFVALFGVVSGKIITRTLYSTKAMFARTTLRVEIQELVAMDAYKPIGTSYISDTQLQHLRAPDGGVILLPTKAKIYRKALCFSWQIILRIKAEQ